LQRCIGCKTRRSIGQGRERKIDVADEADVAVPGRRTAGLRALLLDEFRKLVAERRAEPLDAGERYGLALNFERAGLRPSSPSSPLKMPENGS
jgi:hypothetical protein